MRAAIAIVSTLGLALAAGPEAHAADDADVAAAKRLFAAGGMAYAKGRYAAAIRAFEAAYRFYPDPAVAFSLAQAHRRRFFVDGDRAKLERAVELYRVYLREAPRGRRRAEAVEQVQALESQRASAAAAAAPAPTATARTELLVYAEAPGATASIDGAPAEEVPLLAEVSAGPHEVRVEAPGFEPARQTVQAIPDRMTPAPVELKARPAQVRLQTVAGADVYVDGRLAGRAPLSGPLEISPGAHRLEVQRPGAYPERRELSLERAASLDLQVDLRTTTQRKAAVGLLAGGAGLIALGAGATGLALYYEGQADLGPATGNRSAAQAADINPNLDRRDGFRLAAGIMLGAGAAAALTGGALYLFDAPDAPVVGATPTRGGAIASVQARF